MTIIKNHFEVFLVTSKKQVNGKWHHYRVKSWVIFNKGQFTHKYLSVKCELWPRFHVRNRVILHFTVANVRMRRNVINQILNPN
jgi:hypothetical protein